MADSTLRDVSDTALWVAVYRAQESNRPDALFRDPFALKLAGERGPEIAKRMDQASSYTRWVVVTRTRIIDDLVQSLVAEGVDMVINLGAGLDTRPYCMQLPATLQWIEVDFPHMIQLKNERLASDHPVCQLERVSLDLSNENERNQLFAELSQKSKKVLVITEGVIPYLTNEQALILARDLKSFPQFQYWILEYMSAPVVNYLQSKKRKKMMQNAPFQFAPKDWNLFFQDAGWKIRTLKFTALESETLGRLTPFPLWAKLLTKIVRPPASRDYRKSSGYLVLEQRRA